MATDRPNILVRSHILTIRNDVPRILVARRAIEVPQIAAHHRVELLTQRQRTLNALINLP